MAKKLEYVCLCKNIPKVGDPADSLLEPVKGYARALLEKEYATFPEAPVLWDNILALVIIFNNKVAHVHEYEVPKHIYPTDHIKVHIYQEE